MKKKKKRQRVHVRFCCCCHQRYMPVGKFLSFSVSPHQTTVFICIVSDGVARLSLSLSFYVKFMKSEKQKPIDVLFTPKLRGFSSCMHKWFVTNKFMCRYKKAYVLKRLKFTLCTAIHRDIAQDFPWHNILRRLHFIYKHFGLPNSRYLCFVRWVFMCEFRKIRGKFSIFYIHVNFFVKFETRWSWEINMFLLFHEIDTYPLNNRSLYCLTTDDKCNKQNEKKNQKKINANRIEKLKVSKECGKPVFDTQNSIINKIC